MFQGMDTDQLAAWTDAVRARNSRLAEVAEELRIHAAAVSWYGADADLFRSSATRANDHLKSSISQLALFADNALEHVAEQESASNPRARLPSTLDRASAAASIPIANDAAGGDSGQRRDSRNSDTEEYTLNTDLEQYIEDNVETLAKYEEGDPSRPHFTWDDDFPFNSKAGEETWADRREWAEWGAKLRGAQLLKPELDDALELYEHYRTADGTPMTVDYEEAYSEDPAIAQNVDSSVTEAQAAAQMMIQEGRTDFSFTGPASGMPHYPTTENWQKTLGGYQQWNSGDVTVDENGNARMVVTVHAEDMYNFNAGQSDIATGTPDDVNGKFSELGWAQGFEVNGEVVRVVEWNVNDPDNVTVSVP